MILVNNGQQTRQLHELRTKERAGVTKLREVLEDRLQEIKRAKTWKHERILTSPQDTKVMLNDLSVLLLGTLFFLYLKAGTPQAYGFFPKIRQQSSSIFPHHQA